MTDVFIYDAVRTPRGRGKAGKGGLANIHPQELLAQTLNHMAERTQARQEPGRGRRDRLRHPGQGAGRVHRAHRADRGATGPTTSPAFTVNRFCGSGLEAVNAIAAKIGAGFIDAGIGGGVESMSRVPMGSRRRDARRPQREAAQAAVHGAAGHLGRPDRDARGLHARGRRHVRARSSQQKAARAIEGKRFDSVDVRGQERRRHGRARRATSTRAPTPRSSRSAALQPAFAQMGAMRDGPERRDARRSSRSSATRDTKAIDHVHTAGNSSGIVDGAAVVLMGSAEWGKKRGPQAARADPRDGDRGRRAGDHADRAGAGVAEGAREGRHDGQGHRSVGDQRGVRGGAAADDARARHRSRRGSTSTAARSRSATRSARPARSCSAPRSTSSSARTSRPR